MADPRHTRTLDDVARELDLLVYRLEQPAPATIEATQRAWSDLRRKLERLKDQVEDVARELSS